jgi:hypothetical protein
MKQVLRRGCGWAAVFLGAWSIGCTDEQTGFFIQGNLVLESPDCVATAESSSALLLRGTLDVAIRPEYVATLLVGSQFASRGDKNNLRSETMIANITGAEVHLFKDTGERDGAPFTVPASGVITPDAGNDPGFGIVVATLVPALTGLQIAGELTSRGDVQTRVAEVIVFGKTIGGLDFESAPFNYVIRICEGCLVDFPTDALGATNTCTEPAQEAIEPPCRFGQDDAVDCRLCASNNPFCLSPSDVP